MEDKFEICTVTARVGHEDIKVRLAFRDQRRGSYRLGYDTEEPVPQEYFGITVQTEDKTTDYEAVIVQVHDLYDTPEGLLVCRVKEEDLYFTLRFDPVTDGSKEDWEAGTGILHMSRREFEALAPGQQLTALGYGY